MYCIYILFILSFIFPCNIGVAYDVATNLPVIWKNRDRPICTTQECLNDHTINPNLSEHRANWLHMKNYINSPDVLSLSSAGSHFNKFIGMNRYGFAIVNSVVDNNANEDDQMLSRDGICNNGVLIREALKKCETIGHFRNFLDTLRCYDSDESILSNFAVLDAQGEAGIFEFYIVGNADGGVSSREIDETLLSESTPPYIVRTNHFRNLNHHNPSDTASSVIRYYRSVDMMDSIIDTFEFHHLFNLHNFIDENSGLPLLRNFSDELGSEYQIPYNSNPENNIPFGYFNTRYSLDRGKTTSSAVIIGKDPTNNESESIMWANLGNPITSPYLPLKITDFIDHEGNWIDSTLASEEYNPEDLTSKFSIHTHEIREKMINYNQNSLFDRYINSYLIRAIANEISQQESELINNYLEFGFDINEVALEVISDMESFYDNFNDCNGSDSGMPGDINCSNTLDTLDLIIIISCINEYFTFTNAQETIADYNGDGSIDIIDIILIVNFIFQV